LKLFLKINLFFKHLVEERLRSIGNLSIFVAPFSKGINTCVNFLRILFFFFTISNPRLKEVIA